MAGLSASTYNFIASQTSTGVSSITFSNIPQNYTDLVLVTSIRGTSSQDDYAVQYNGDANSSYSWMQLVGDGSSSSAHRYSSQPVARIGDYTANSSYYGVTTTHIMSYSNPNVYSKMHLSRSSNGGSGGAAVAFAATYTSFNPITSITIKMGAANTIVSGSTFTLYGIKAADTSTLIPTKAFGGDSIVTDGTYTYHVFKNSGTFTTTNSITADLLVIAGGGGSGGSGGSGGGAGGVVAASSQSLSASTSYTCVIGSGGNTASYAGGRSSGNTSQISGSGLTTVTANGGQGGANGNSTGGSSGSGSYTGGSGGSGGPAGGGGAGAGQNGGNGYNYGGPGGNGVNTYSVWAIATNTGVNGYYGGGGAGGTNNNTYIPQSGGLGGGGDSSGPSVFGASTGIVNTGGGAGGGGNGSQGGSGLIIVRYLS